MERVNKCNKGYQPKRNLLKNENVDLLADSCDIRSRWGNYFSQLLNEHRVIGSVMLEDSHTFS